MLKTDAVTKDSTDKLIEKSSLLVAEIMVKTYEKIGNADLPESVQCTIMSEITAILTNYILNTNIQSTALEFDLSEYLRSLSEKDLPKA